MKKKFLEKNLEEIICDSNREELLIRGLDVKGELRRQFSLGKYGRADIISFEKYNKEEEQNKNSADYLATIYELKEGKIDFDTFSQALRYVYGFIIRNKTLCHEVLYQYKIVLIGNKLSDKDEFKSFHELISPKLSSKDDIDKVIGIDLYEYSYGINGINFKKNDYYLKEEINKII